MRTHKQEIWYKDKSDKNIDPQNYIKKIIMLIFYLKIICTNSIRLWLELLFNINNNDYEINQENVIIDEEENRTRDREARVSIESVDGWCTKEI